MAETDESGFTLIEMIVSLALMSLIAMLLIQSLQATGLVTRSAQRLGAQEEVQLVRGHLRRTLANVVRRRRDGKRVAFLGQSGALTATIGANAEAERISQIAFGLTTAAAPDGSVALVEDTRVTSETATGPQREVLLDGILGLRLRYFGTLGQGGASDWQPRWVTTWPRNDRLPTLVEVSVDFPAADARRWPALVLPLGAGP
ncbi:prepilin-type N-terminal cleavage/methylation domain-containing protein [Methylorubrum sp. SB2]|uniref:prepilin-type N-terminal cleavage/methylation domain-containing protein n=1 Tax=Methylorubrum subtropicum TaxID=3138812 RepID=UPI00313D15A9